METTTVIPKDKLKSCQLWQWDTLESSESNAVSKRHEKEGSVEKYPMDHINENDHADKEKSTEPSEAEVTAIVQQARESGHKQGHDEGLNKGYQEGYGNGYQEGHNKGFQEGRQQGEIEINNVITQVRGAFENLDEQLQTLDQQVAQNLLALAIDLTKKMTTQALVIQPELILSIVQDAIRQLPNTMQHLRLFLNPGDARIVRQYLNDQLTQENWEICEDDQMIQGGCRVEAGGSEVDASIETRWRRILATIGQKNDWIEK